MARGEKCVYNSYPLQKMTVAFEFLCGHFVLRRPWNWLLHDYNLFAGRVWVVLMWLTMALSLFYRL